MTTDFIQYKAWREGLEEKAQKKLANYVAHGYVVDKKTEEGVYLPYNNNHPDKRFLYLDKSGDSYYCNELRESTGKSKW